MILLFDPLWERPGTWATFFVIPNSRFNLCNRGNPLFNPFDVVDDACAALDDFDPELRMIFKRILKKEQSTRIRGLQEFKRWLETCTDNDFIKVRGLFIKIYEQGAEDEERNIRELAGGCLQTIVKRNKKWLAPIFKDILYVWIGNFADVSSVSRIAKASFQACFGESGYPEVCRVAFSVVVREALSSLDRGGTTIDLMHAFSNLIFMISFADAETCERMRAEFASGRVTATNITMADPSVKIAAYQFYRLALRRDLLQRSELLTSILFRSLLDDLTSVASSEALSLLCMYEVFTDEMVSEVASTIQSSLPSEIHDAIIEDLATLLNHLPPEMRSSILWSTLTEKKILDTERLARIWSLFVSCCLDEKFQKCNLCPKLLLPSTISEVVRTRVIEKIALKSNKVLEIAFQGLLQDSSATPGYKLQVALEVSPLTDNDFLVRGPELSVMMSGLTSSQQGRLISYILESPKRGRLHELLLEIAPDTLDFVSIYSSVKSMNNREDEVLKLFASKIQRQLVGMDVTQRVGAYAATAKFDSIRADKETILYALDNINADSVRVVISCFREAFSAHFKEGYIVEPTTLHLLRNLAKEAALRPEHTALKALFTMIEFVQGGVHSAADILVTTDFLFHIDSSLRKALTDKILASNYSLNDKIMELFHHAFPGILEDMQEHVTSASVALTGYPILLPKASYAARLWTKDVDFLEVLDPLLRHASYNEDIGRKNEILLYNAFIQCLRDEEEFRPLGYQNTIVLPSVIPLNLVSLEVIPYIKGFCLLSARDAGASISLSQLLEPHTPLSYSVLPIREMGTEREKILKNTSLTYDSWLKVLAVQCEWTKDEYYQMLSDRELLSIAVELSGTDQGILAKMMHAAFAKGSVSQKTYWSQHADIVEGLVLNLRQLWRDSDSRLANHPTVLSTLKLLDLPSISDDAIQRHLELIFGGLKSFAGDPALPAFSKVFSQFSRLLAACDDRPQLLSFIGDEVLAGILFESQHPFAKLAARRIIMSRSDDFLNKIKHRPEMSTDAPGEANTNGRILIPSETFLKILTKPQEEVVLMNSVLALDIFLALAEGSKEEARVFAAYVDFFREQVAPKYLPYLCKCLRWDTDTPIDLNRMEITVLALEDESLGDLAPYTANVLFRSFKTFPITIRTWYSELPKEWSSRILKYTAQFLSPLLIERELTRIRKASLDPIKLRIIQSSTTCAVQVNYHLEEFQLSYALTIPLSYPLKPVTVQGSDQQQRLGISAGKWRTWLLSVQSLLAQNLAIVDAIRQWKANAEKVLQGVEPCSVCYCVLQPSDRSLPGPSCKTCRNRFHSMCLYRWFKTSGQATCPMCRSLF